MIIHQVYPLICDFFKKRANLSLPAFSRHATVTGLEGLFFLDLNRSEISSTSLGDVALTTVMREI